VEQEYDALQATHKKMHDFQVPDTAFHLHLPRGSQHAHDSSLRRSQRATGRSPHDRDRDRGGAATGGAAGRLPDWYREAREDARGMRLSASAPASSFARFSRRATPSAAASPRAGLGGGAGADKKARPQSAAPRARAGAGSRDTKQRRPHSAFRVSDRSEKRDEFMSAGEDEDNEDDDGPDWLAYSEQEVREGLLGAGAVPEKQRQQQREDSPVRPRQEQEELPVRELTEAQQQQAARHGLLGGLLGARSQHWAALLAEPSCRVRCSLLSELPAARVALPLPVNPDQQPPFSPSRSPQSRRHRAAFSVALFDLGLVCAPALLQATSSPQMAGQEAVAAAAGILVECRLQQGGEGADGKHSEDEFTHSLFVPLAQLQTVCEAGGSNGESASTASLSRKLLRLRAVDRPRRLFAPLGGPRGLGAEGVEQLCNFVTDNLQVRVQELHEEREGRGSPLSRRRNHERTEVLMSLWGADPSSK